MRIVSVAILLAATYPIIATAAQPNANLIENPGFEAGNQSFISGYPTPDLDLSGTYSIGNDPSRSNPNWQNTTRPHGGNAMMIVDGTDQPDTIVWQEGPIIVRPHTTYFLGAYAASLFLSSPPVLIFRINGLPVGSPFSLTGAVGRWTPFCAAWNSGESGKASISITDQNTELYGNDFGLDDLSFETSPPSTPQDQITQNTDSCLSNLASNW